MTVFKAIRESLLMPLFKFWHISIQICEGTAEFPGATGDLLLPLSDWKNLAFSWKFIAGHPGSHGQGPVDCP